MPILGHQENRYVISVEFSLQQRKYNAERGDQQHWEDGTLKD
jgi:hypothetical protein